MKNIYHLYLDDSGTRHPTRKTGNNPAHGRDWFALGGVIVNKADETFARELHQGFVKRWNIEIPLHSSEIRGRSQNFLWLRSLPETRRRVFYEELSRLMQDAPVLGMACVIDRPGYCGRYLERYNKEPWLLCKTAFGIVVERAAKYARNNNGILKVFPERCNKVEDRALKGYYDDLRHSGPPFDKQNSSDYKPLSSREFSDVLHDFKLKHKTSPMAQFADLYLWPICMGGYDKNNRPFKRLMNYGKLIEAVLPESEWPVLGTKYSCFEGVTSKS